MAENDLAAKIHRGIYQCSDKANAPENASAQFQAGFQHGMEMTCEPMDAIIEEYRKRKKSFTAFRAFKEWKRGMWAAYFQRLTNRDVAP